MAHRWRRITDVFNETNEVMVDILYSQELMTSALKWMPLRLPAQQLATAVRVSQGRRRIQVSV
jgi:hypothetical protein